MNEGGSQERALWVRNGILSCILCVIGGHYRKSLGEAPFRNDERDERIEQQHSM